MIIWLIGMSGSGKTTLASELYKALKPTCPPLLYLDGDVLRETFGNDVDHTVAGRNNNAARISNLCKFLDKQNIHAIAAVLSIFPEWQQWNRDNFKAYYEIFLDIPMEELERRDTKGLYAGARAGRIPNVVGVDIPFPPPKQPELTLTLQDQQQGVQPCVHTILDRIPPLV